MRPSCKSRIRSAFWMVESRWAITKQVRPFIRASMASWIRCSVAVSTLEVASSKISMGASSSMALAMVKSWRCPLEILTPPSERTVS